MGHWLALTKECLNEELQVSFSRPTEAGYSCRSKAQCTGVSLQGPAHTCGSMSQPSGCRQDGLCFFFLTLRQNKPKQNNRKHHNGKLITARELKPEAYLKHGQRQSICTAMSENCLFAELYF